MTHEERARELVKVEDDAQLGRGGCVTYVCGEIVATSINREVAEKHAEKFVIKLAHALQEAEAGVWEAVIQQIARNETVAPHIGPLWNAGWMDRSSSLLKWCREQVALVRDGKPN